LPNKLKKGRCCNALFFERWRKMNCNIRYEVSKDGAVLTKVLEIPDDGVLVFPNEVETIGNNIWQGIEVSNIKAVFLPDGIKNIRKGAFKHLINLKCVGILGCSDIDDNAFAYCENLETVLIPETLQSIGINVFLGCGKLKNVKVHSVSEAFIKAINTSLFSMSEDVVYTTTDDMYYECDNMIQRMQEENNEMNASFSFLNGILQQYQSSEKDIKVWDRINTISPSAFCKCDKVSVIEIPESVCKIGKKAFDVEAETLEKIVVSEENINYKSVDGVLFNKDGTILIKYPCGKDTEDVAIPNNVQKIEDRAFKNCKYIRSVKVSENVKSIAGNAFWGCVNLEKVIMFPSVEKIEKSAFDNCPCLKEIQYWGTIEEWEKLHISLKADISIMGGLSNKEPTTESTVISASEPTAEPNIAPTFESTITPTIEPAVIPTSADVVKPVVELTIAPTVEPTEETSEPKEKLSMQKMQEEILKLQKANEVLQEENKVLQENKNKLCDKIVKKENDCAKNQKVMETLRKEKEDAENKVKLLNGELKSKENEIESLKKQNENINFRKKGYRADDDSENNKFKISRMGIITQYTSSDDVVIIPDKVGNIYVKGFEANVFAHTNIKSIKFSKGIKEIPNGAFYGCESLRDINIPDTVTEIENGAFQHCINLKSLILNESEVYGKGLKKIGADAFYGCSNLEEVIIPNSVEQIGNFAFYGCKNLRELILGYSLTEIGEYAFADCISLKGLIIPNTVNYIGNSAFQNCVNMKCLSIENGVGRISGRNIFQNCKSLQAVSLPGSMQIIPESMFAFCRNLKKLRLGAGIEKISDDAFNRCRIEVLENIPQTLKEVSKSAFNDCSKDVCDRIQKHIELKQAEMNKKGIICNFFDFCKSLFDG